MNDYERIPEIHPDLPADAVAVDECGEDLCTLTTTAKICVAPAYHARGFTSAPNAVQVRTTVRDALHRAARVAVDVEIGVEADDAAQPQALGGFGDRRIGQVERQAGKTLGDAAHLRQAGVGGHIHDHGAALARDLGYAPVYLRYNSGLHVSILSLIHI